MKIPASIALVLLGVLAAVTVSQGPEPPAGPGLPALVQPDAAAPALSAPPAAPVCGREGCPLGVYVPPSVWHSPAAPAVAMGLPRESVVPPQDPLRRLQAQPTDRRAQPMLIASDADIQFSGEYKLDPVPEPGSWLLMMLGFGLVGLHARRRHLATL